MDLEYQVKRIKIRLERLETSNDVKFSEFEKDVEFSEFEEGLSVRSVNFLVESGINSISKIRDIRLSDLHGMHGVGRKTINEICERMGIFGIKFAKEFSVKKKFPFSDYTKKRNMRIFIDRLSGNTLSDIASRHDMTPQSVRMICSKASYFFRHIHSIPSDDEKALIKKTKEYLEDE